MRTTLTIEDRVARDLKEIAHREERSFKDIVNEALREGLAARKGKPKARRYRMKPVSLGEPNAAYDLDKSIQLSDAIEESEIARKLDLRK